MSLNQKRHLEKKQIKSLIIKNENHLIPFDNVMKLLLPGNTMPGFVRVKTRKEFTDGFMITGCQNIRSCDLKTHLIMNQLDVDHIITTKTPGNMWVQLKDGH